MKFRFCLEIVPVLLLSILLNSCHKKKQHELRCKILQMNYAHDPTVPVIANFEYNSWDYPKTITVSKPTTGNSNFIFKYDNNRRLNEVISHYGYDNPEYLRKFICNNSNMIVLDTFFYPVRAQWIILFFMITKPMLRFISLQNIFMTQKKGYLKQLNAQGQFIIGHRLLQNINMMPMVIYFCQA